jgi:hypothetical protein
MPEYRLSLDFTAADDTQAERLAEAWAGTCAAEYGTRMAGVDRIDRFCVTLGHEMVPAAQVGTYDDGNVVFPGTAYCARCAELMTRAGDWTADRTATGTYPTFDPT